MNEPLPMLPGSSSVSFDTFVFVLWLVVLEGVWSKGGGEGVKDLGM